MVAKTNVSSRQDQKLGRQAAPLFQRGGEPPDGAKQTAERTVLYLGKINDSQEAMWRRTLQVFDEAHQQYTTLSLFPEDREIPAESSNSIQVRLNEMELRRPQTSATAGWGASCGGTAAGRILGREVSGEGTTRNHVSGEAAAAAGGESFD